MKTASGTAKTWSETCRVCWKSFRRALRWALVSGIAGGLACLLLVAPTEDVVPPQMAVQSLGALPNHNFVPEVEALRRTGSLQEALELARFITANPELPGQAEAARLESEINRDLHSVLGHSKRAISGFVTGEGSSVDEIGGAIASDMILYGDLRDLCKQGYRHVRGQETDGLIASLAAIGLLTECIDVADWGPAVLKALRKANSLTKRFAQWTVGACRRSVKARKLEPALCRAMTDLRHMVKKLGFGRTATITRHVDSADDLAAVAKAARRSPDTAYLMVKLGGDQGIDILRAAERTTDGMDILKTAAKKGPAGLEWLRHNGIVRRVVLATRVGTRTTKNFHLGRPQQLFHRGLDAASERYPWVKRTVMWAGPVSVAVTAIGLFMMLLHLVHIPTALVRRMLPRRRTTSHPDNRNPSGSIVVAR
jgi:hypothetical protein